ncbi:hypothetical protein C2E31_16275 [Rhodopirellula baltica]|nr:hypothetical protein C2E31_16275 [Rhodopirellula baltica]
MDGAVVLRWLRGGLLWVGSESLSRVSRIVGAGLVAFFSRWKGRGRMFDNIHYGVWRCCGACVVGGRMFDNIHYGVGLAGD